MRGRGIFPHPTGLAGIVERGRRCRHFLRARAGEHIGICGVELALVDVGAVARERLFVGGEHVGFALGDELRLARGLGFGCLLAHAGGFEGQGRRCRLALDAGHEVGLRAGGGRGGRWWRLFLFGAEIL